MWIDATQDLDDIRAKIYDTLRASPIPNAEEYAILDYEDFEGYEVSEYEGLAEVQEIALFIEEYGKLGAELLNYYSNLEEAKKAMDDRYHGQYESIGDYAQKVTEESTEIPQHLTPYIDFESMGKDWEHSGDIVTFELNHGEVHIFSGH